MSRRRARELALQAIYQWELNPMPMIELVQQFVETNNMQKVDFDHFRQVLDCVVHRTADIDAHIKPYLDRDLNDLDPIELAILRLSTCEMMNALDVPYRVVINEGIELAKKFGSTDGHKYINGLLDKLAVQLRPVEIKR